jgi:hypothetical protein
MTYRMVASENVFRESKWPENVASLPMGLLDNNTVTR